MLRPLADRLNAARQRQFVGREAEIALLDEALDSDEPPFALLYLFGPGGVGKTTLLQQFAARCAERRVPAVLLDARSVEPSPEAFCRALAQSMGLAPDADPLAALADSPGRRVLLIDTYESLAPLDGWIRSELLPQLPVDILIVVAGRKPPCSSWRADPGWQSLLQTVSLRNLSAAESRRYLERRRVPVQEHGAVLDFTHGHPLALSLVADVYAQRADFHFEPDAAPDVIQALLERFVQRAPGPAHRAALETCALVRVTTESLLAEILAIQDAHELFEWLRGLSFVETGRRGLFPHDLAREALTADLRWRNPEWCTELLRRARVHYAARLRETSGQEQQRVLVDYIYLNRDNPVVRPFFDWNEVSSVYVDSFREGDRPAVYDMVARHEGEESAHLADYWVGRPEHPTLVVRRSGADGAAELAGFLVLLGVHRTTPQERATDPAVRAAFEYVRRMAPLREGECSTLFRFWMAADTYQQVSPTQSLLFVNMVRHYLTTPGLALTFMPMSDPDFWSPVCGYAELKRMPEADFEISGHQYGVYGNDWRALTAEAWLALLAQKARGAQPELAPTPAAPQVLVLSHPDFGTAVRDALRAYTHPAALRRSPLLRSRVVVERTGLEAPVPRRVAALQSLVEETVSSLQAAPRLAKLYRVLHRTYLDPAPTQEQAADILDLPFSTYRRHLTAGIEAVVESLWEAETGSAGK